MQSGQLLVGPGCPQDVLSFITTAALPGTKVEVAHSAIERLDESRSVYVQEAGKRRVYGYCTGLGEIYDKQGVCGPEWERTVLAEHAAQTGKPAPPGVVRAFLAVRLLQLSRGAAPVRGIVAERIAEALSLGVIPVIPLYGSVGASGDLAPSAHAFQCIFYGLGEAYYEGHRLPCSEALRQAGLEPLMLEPGEALALINNTAWSTAIAGLSLWLLERVLWESIGAAVDSLGLARCQGEHYSPDVAKLRPGRGIASVLEALSRAGCTGSRLQDPYSLRCIPMVYGAVLEGLSHARDLIAREACSPTENPAVVDGKVLHWCGFHSIQASLASDYARILASHVANIVERRIAQLFRPEITGLPPFMARPGSSVGAMIAHYTAASITALLRQYSSPAGIHSIPTSGLQEDIVPQSPNAAILLARTTVLLARLVAIERAVARYAREEHGQAVGVLVEEEYERLRGDPEVGYLLSQLEQL